jgi:AraC family transcriptional regulator, transcriptional activator FtrA
MDEHEPCARPGDPLVLVLAYDGVDDLDFFGVWSVLSKAAQTAPAAAGSNGLRLRMMCPKGRFTSASGVSVTAPDADDGGPADALVVPGGPGALDASRSAPLQARLTGLRENGARFYTICSGALVLAASGLLQGMRVAIHGSKKDLIKDAGCREILSGCQRDQWLTSIGGEPSPSVKSVRIGFRVLEDLCPTLAVPVSRRMEIVG